MTLTVRDTVNNKLILVQKWRHFEWPIGYLKVEFGNLKIVAKSLSSQHSATFFKSAKFHF
jgi:hypothetical protein